MKKIFFFSLYLLSCALLYSQWTEFHVKPGQSIWASSSLSETLGGKVVSYTPDFLFDNDLATAWVEGAADEGIGENLIVLTNKAVREISLNNGFCRSPSLYEKNNRVKKLKLSVLIGFTAPGMISENDYELFLLKEFISTPGLLIEDKPERQSFPITVTTEEQFELCRTVLGDFGSENPFLIKMILDEIGIPKEKMLSDWNLSLIMEVYGFYALKLSIDEVYKGSRYNDSCLSEISLELEDFY